jgi:hypothetical protein
MADDHPCYLRVCRRPERHRERCPNHAECWRRCNVQLGFHARRVGSPAFTTFCSLTLIRFRRWSTACRRIASPQRHLSSFTRRFRYHLCRAWDGPKGAIVRDPHLRADASGGLSLRVLKDAYRKSARAIVCAVPGEAGSCNGNSVNKRGATWSRNPVHPAYRLALNR